MLYLMSLISARPPLMPGVKLNMKNSHTIRNIAAILLLICLVLPLSKCTKTTVEVDPEGKVVASGKVMVEHSYLVPIKEIQVKDPYSFLFLLPFIWPFPFWQFKNRISSKTGIYLFHFIEVFLLCFSTYFIIIWTFYFGNPFWGGFLAVICLAALWIVYLLPILSNIKGFIKKRI